MNYQEMNREERYFCFLLGHALLVPGQFRDNFCDLLNKNLALPEDGELFIANGLGVYPEAAWLRDYWYWQTKRRENRLKVLNKILKGAFSNGKGNEEATLYEAFGLGQSLDEFKMVTEKPEMKFLRSTKRKTNTLGEITSPGLWGLNAIRASGLPKKCQLKLARLKWAFNAKPDLMLVSGGRVVLIEAKLESREDKYSFEYADGSKDDPVEQTTIQSVEISSLMKFLSVETSQDPEGSPQEFKDVQCLLLTKKGKLGFNWKDHVISLLDESEVDDFTKEGFAKANVFCK